MEAVEMTLDDYIAIVKRRIWSLLIPALLIVSVAVIVALILPPVFRSTATILIEEQEIPANLVMTTVTSYAEQRLQAIHQRIMSTSRLQEMINKFDLYKEDRGKMTHEEIISQMREDIKLEHISVDTVDRRTGRPTVATIAFALSFEGSESPGTIQRVANTLTTLFLEENIKTREQQTMETSDFLLNELNSLKKSLTEVEQRIANFKRDHFNELPEVLQVNMQSLAKYEANFDNLTSQLSSMSERESFLAVQLAGIPEKLDAVIGSDDPDERRLEELKIQLINLKAKFSDEYPDVKKTKTEISELEKVIEGKESDDITKDVPDNPAYINISSQLAGVKSEIKAARDQMRSFDEKISEYENRLAATSKVEEEYRALTIQRDNLQRQFEEMTRKHMEASLAHGLEKEQKGERFTLIDPAQLPEKPFKPNRLAIVLIGLVLGCGAGVGMASLQEFSDNSIRSAASLARIVDVPVLATIPTIVTSGDKTKERMKALAYIFIILAVVAACAASFHFFVMDFDVLTAKIMRRFAM